MLPKSVRLVNGDILTRRQFVNDAVEWIGDIPDDWEVIRFKNILQVRDDLSTNGDELLLSVSQYTGVTPRSEKIEDGDFISRADSLVGYRICNRNDLVMNIMLAWNGSLAFSNYDGIVSPAYAVFFIYNNNFYYKFLHYLLRTSAYTSYFRANSTGIIDSRLRLYPDVFGRLYCIYPPLATQQKIADYLDEKCGEIDKTIEKQKESIEKLKAYKQSLISETVTKGLNKSTPLKPTGIDFLGDIPSHWEVKKLKYGVRLLEEKEKAVRSISLENIESFTGKLIETENIYEGEGIAFQPYDILFGKLRPYLAKVYLSTFKGQALGDFYVLRAKQDILPNFLKFVLLSDWFIKIVDSSTYGTKMPRASWDFVGGMKIIYPSIKEQNEIAEYLDKKCEEIDSTINKKQNLIEKLDAYKKSLIFECVTGKRRI